MKLSDATRRLFNQGHAHDARPASQRKKSKPSEFEGALTASEQEKRFVVYAAHLAREALKQALPERQAQQLMEPDQGSSTETVYILEILGVVERPSPFKDREIRGAWKKYHNLKGNPVDPEVVQAQVNRTWNGRYGKTERPQPPARDPNSLQSILQSLRPLPYDRGLEHAPPPKLSDLQLHHLWGTHKHNKDIRQAHMRKTREISRRLLDLQITNLFAVTPN